MLTFVHLLNKGFSKEILHNILVKGGKKLSFRAVVVVGDQQGKVGVGVGNGCVTTTQCFKVFVETNSKNRNDLNNRVVRHLDMSCLPTLSVDSIRIQVIYKCIIRC